MKGRRGGRKDEWMEGGLEKGGLEGGRDGRKNEWKEGGGGRKEGKMKKDS